MPPAASTSAKKTPSLKSLQTKLRGLQTSLSNISKFVQTVDETTTASQAVVRLDRLDELWEKTGDVMNEIETHEDYEAEADSLTKDRIAFEDRYYEMKAFLVDKIKELQDPGTLEQSVRGTETTMVASGDHVRLPQIKLQSFGGNIDEWLSFRDLFTSLIHRKADLSEVEKLHYLKGCLEGEAKALIDPLKLTKGNYSIAWDTLLRRYNNSKLLKRRQVQALFKLPVVVRESATELHKLLEGFERATQTLDQVVELADYKDLLLIEILSSRLDAYTRRGWEELSSTKESDTLKDLTEFLHRRLRILESMPAKGSDTKPEQAHRNKAFTTRASHNAVQSSTAKCYACSENHWLPSCPKFQRMTVAGRESLLRTHSLCRNCFRKGHQSKDCSSKYSCKRCKGRHHTMVCFKTEPDSNNRMASMEGASASPLQGDNTEVTTKMDSNIADRQVRSANIAQKHSSRVLLATAVVIIEDDEGTSHTARALLDSGSECNFVSERLCKQMSITKERVDVSVVGIGVTSAKVKHMIRANIKSRNTSFSQVMSLLVLPKVTANLPTTSVQTTGWDIPQGIKLADPSFFLSNCVDLVLGIQSFFGFFQTGKAISLGEGLPLLTDSVFGWIVSGEVTSLPRSSQITCNVAASVNLERIMERFWSCEEVEDTRNYSPEETRCEEHFRTTVQRDSNGRYTVSLPIKENILAQLGESREIALKRFFGLERRLARNENLRKQYHDFMAEYLALSHMRQVDNDSTTVKRCYLPHHPVVKEDSTTTKVRVVFDASCQTSTALSVNDALLVGPVIQQDLRSIILRCRTRQIMLVADVEKMFRQIKMNPADAPLQSILWRFRETDEVGTYELMTVTYGTKPAPFLATRTLKQLALDEALRWPLAAKVIENDVYMDDVITGANDIATAIDLRVQLDAMMEGGGFRLRKWASNCTAVLKDISQDNLALPANGINWDQDSTVKALGLTWLPKTDLLKFRFNIANLCPETALTKRKVLSIIASLFDPLGLLGATITLAKIFMQRLWSARNENGHPLEWDSPLPELLDADWRNFHHQLSLLNDIRIPRCVIAPNAESVQIHCFSDASERAYGGCLYVRTIDTSKQVTVKLLTAKSKVAPLKTQSLPRLELCGAKLTAQLWEKVAESIGANYEVHFWTDSTCVLRWIRASPSSWVTYIANRVSKIQAITENHIWHHVPGLCNPADLISRGVTPDVLIRSSLWWEGPDWLKEEKNQWPQWQEDHSEEALIERRHTVASAVVNEYSFINEYIAKFSSYTKLLRITAYCLRWKNNCQIPKEKVQKGFLTSAELREAEFIIVRKVQQEVFAEDIKRLSKGEAVSRHSLLRWFNPRIAENGILRVGGRLGHSQEPSDAKHPMVLPAKHVLTELILQHYHHSLLHAGLQLLLATVRQRFWPLGGRNVARKIIHRCQRCFRANPRAIRQQMGELPAARVTVSRPFVKCGVDYFGPVYIRAGRRQTAIKTYVAIFVCMSTKAVHMEHVSDLSTERFLQALRRFFARRGRSSDMYSDNGTNFVGARNQLRELFALLKDSQHQQAVARECSSKGIQWHFNPPSAPHFGGLWEAAVRSTKYHLLRVLGGNPVSAEDFVTLLVQVEACLNSRPLTPMSDDPLDLRPLTPAHFLTGESLQAVPEPDYSTVPLNRLSHWQLVQRQLQDFWKRWKTEYLVQLQSRTKNWELPVKVEIGRLVVIMEANQPPMRWKLGRIHELHPGADEVVRVVTIKTATGYLTRPVEKLCFLPQVESTTESESSQ
ncbi:uncharacterized protein LOC128736171 [Sabethes cyaneus]|uniref:uncharacterized protein LOC128736171 n=1 Tax=Sabethes cyaneus TaxID=53552 RepID=UPI00237E295D|nr:uncharacterized protein LOC128736171 [Sabethes cyaneus]